VASAFPRALALAALLSVVACGCASRRPVELIPATEVEPAAVEPAPPPEPAADLDALYARLEADRADYEEGIDLIAAGEETAGEERIVAASGSLRAGAAECAAAPGCEFGRFLDAFEALLSLEEIALKKQSVQIDTLEEGIAAEEVEREPGTTTVVGAVPEVARTLSLLRGNDLREMIRLNGQVQAAISDWLTWMRPMLLEAWFNYQFLREEMAPIYEQAGLPEALLFAVLATETGGKVHSFSRAGAAGPLQFMRLTGRRYGLGVENGFDTRLDPAAATRANVAYLNERFAELNDNLELALAAYNGGEGRVQSLHRRNPKASFWDDAVFWSLPTETREYVPRILAAAWLFLHPEDYGVSFRAVSAERTDLSVHADISIEELAVCLGQELNEVGWFRTLRNLNPRLDPGERIEAGGTLVFPAALVPVYEQRCVDGELLARARELHEASHAAQPELVPYVVRRGDTLGRIAARHRCVTLRELAEINRIRPPRYVIHVGQRLKIPTCG